jgi:uncharacterized protein (TIGR03067 family)
MLIPTVVVLALSGRSAADDPAAKKDTKQATGDWQLVDGELGGKKFPSDVVKGIKLSLTGDKYVVTAENRDEGTVKYIPNTSPAAMEITGTDGPNKGKTFPAIYKLEGDTLTICYDLSGKARPTEFKSKPGTLLFLATYNKAKP